MTVTNSVFSTVPKFRLTTSDLPSPVFSHQNPGGPRPKFTIDQKQIKPNKKEKITMTALWISGGTTSETTEPISIYDHIISRRLKHS